MRTAIVQGRSRPTGCCSRAHPTEGAAAAAPSHRCPPSPGDALGAIRSRRSRAGWPRPARWCGGFPTEAACPRASFRPGFYREEQSIVARDQPRRRCATTPPNARRRRRELDHCRGRSLRNSAAIAVVHLVFLALFVTAAAEDRGVLMPPPIMDVAQTAPRRRPRPAGRHGPDDGGAGRLARARPAAACCARRGSRPAGR